MAFPSRTWDFLYSLPSYHILVVIVTIFVVKGIKRYVKYRHFAQAINKLPGAPGLPIVGNLLQLYDYKGDFWHKQTLLWSLEFQNSPVFRIWTAHYPLVLLNSPDAVETILRSPRHISKSFHYSFLKPWIGNSLLTSSGDIWHSKRKLLTPTFHFNILADYLEVFNEQSLVLVDKLRSVMHERGNKGVDLLPCVTRCTLDIICATAMGRHKDAQNDPNSDYTKATQRISRIIVRRSLSPWLHPDWVFKRTIYGEKQEHCLKTLHGFTNQVIQERKLARQEKKTFLENGVDEDNNDYPFPNKKRLAFLDLLLTVSEDGHVLSDKDIREETDTFMIGGHSTTSAAISWSTFLIGSHPEIQEKVYEEVTRVLGCDLNRPITMKDLSNLKYLECCMKEALRLYPSIPFYARDIQEDVTIGNCTLPAGCTAVIFPYMLHRLPSVYPDPEAFIPERFLPENCIGRHPYAYVPFSAGPRNCIGQKFAIMEEKVILANMFRYFHVESLDKRENIKLSFELAMQPRGSLNFILTPRSS